MPLDIVIESFNGQDQKSIPLYLDDYDQIMEVIANYGSQFSLTSAALANYYGDFEVFHENLSALKQEATLLINKDESFSKSTKEFLDDYIKIIQLAIESRQSLKFFGD
jgi:hypothetical protein